MSDTLALVEALIAQPSVTPDDRHCQRMLSERLNPMGFECEFMVSGPAGAEVTNLWALRRAKRPDAPVLVFAGHTDVVPPGPREHWDSDPFVPTHREGRLYGRGASDMKTSLAAMVVATQQFLQAHPTPTSAWRICSPPTKKAQRSMARWWCARPCKRAASGWTGASWASPPR